MNTSRNVVIVGGGLPGLFSALLISDRYPGFQVHVIERDTTLGGLYNSFKDEQAGWFDHGMHLIYESSIEEVDRHIRQALDEKDWIVLEGNRKDIAGLFYNRTLHQDSPYIDLRELPEHIRRECLSDLCLQLGHAPHKAGNCSSARDFFLKRFGASITDRVIEPVLSKLWNTDGISLDPMATRVVLMDRVCLYDSDTMDDLMKSDLIRSRIAFPKQMELPLRYRSTQRGLYPRQYGMYRVIEAIGQTLVGRGVRIHKQAEVREIVRADGEIQKVHVRGPGAEFVVDDIRLLHWSIPLFGLVPKFGLHSAPARFDPPHTQACVYFLLHAPPEMGDLYYFYCFDPGYHTYRVTNYSAYCPDARLPEGTYPICVELHFEAGASLESMDLAALAIRELMEFGVIESDAGVAFSRVEVSRVGFPVLTLNNSRIIGQLRELVDSQGIRNLITAGQAPERGIFFLHDILEHSYNAIVNWQDWS